jgi:hypothetical protein
MVERLAPTASVINRRFNLGRNLAFSTPGNSKDPLDMAISSSPL